jgi:hypothetical protein
VRPTPPPDLPQKGTYPDEGVLATKKYVDEILMDLYPEGFPYQFAPWQVVALTKWHPDHRAELGTPPISPRTPVRPTPCPDKPQSATPPTRMELIVERVLHNDNVSCTLQDVIDVNNHLSNGVVGKMTKHQYRNESRATRCTITKVHHSHVSWYIGGALDKTGL